MGLNRVGPKLNRSWRPGDPSLRSVILKLLTKWALNTLGIAAEVNWCQRKLWHVRGIANRSVKMSLDVQMEEIKADGVQMVQRMSCFLEAHTQKSTCFFLHRNVQNNDHKMSYICKTFTQKSLSEFCCLQTWKIHHELQNKKTQHVSWMCVCEWNKETVCRK